MSAVSSAFPSASSSAGTAVDPTLLTSLPATVDGTVLTEDADTEHQDVTDPANAADLAGLAVAIAVDTDSGDLAVASVVRVRPGVFSDAYFKDWRSTFDTGACSQAGGVSATGQAVIGGRDAFTATCSGGLVLEWRDRVPGPGWGLLDSAGVPKATWHALLERWRASVPELGGEPERVLG